MRPESETWVTCAVWRWHDFAGGARVAGRRMRTGVVTSRASKT